MSCPTSPHNSPGHAVLVALAPQLPVAGDWKRRQVVYSPAYGLDVDLRQELTATTPPDGAQLNSLNIMSEAVENRLRQGDGNGAAGWRTGETGRGKNMRLGHNCGVGRLRGTNEPRAHQGALLVIGVIYLGLLGACGTVAEPPRRGGNGPAAAETPGTTPGSAEMAQVDWDVPGAGVLFYRGRGYRLHESAATASASPRPDRVIGATALRWQTGGVFPPGTAIYSIADLPTEQLLALKAGNQTFFFREDDQATTSLNSTQVVLGTVKGAGSPVCAWLGCLDPPPGQRAVGSVSTPATIAINRVLHGSTPADAKEIEVRQIGTADEPLPNARPAALAPGSTVILFLQPARLVTVGDFGYGDYYWTGLGAIYRVEGDRVTPLGMRDTGDPPVSVDQFSTAVVEGFHGVQPRDPTGLPTSPMAPLRATEGTPGAAPTTILPAPPASPRRP